MNKIITMLTVSIIGLTAQAQSTETNVVAFTRIEAADGVEIYLTQSKTFSVNAGSERENLSNVRTEVKGNTLKIRKMDRNATAAKIYISAPVITSINASSNSRIIVNKWLTGDHIMVSLSSGAFFMGNIKSEKLMLKAISGSIFRTRIESEEMSCHFKSDSKIILSGSAQKAFIRTDSGAVCSARNFISNDITVNAGELSSVTFNANSHLRITMAPTAKVTYYGNPENVQIPADAITINRKSTDQLLTSN